ncbi:MAG: helix-turn-helix transcriptional regulator [Clostridia bacterium]|nr:helix-turn-helix transcriptional regulator [Clostridia bacterium]
MQERKQAWLFLKDREDGVPMNSYMHLARNSPGKAPAYLHYHRWTEFGICLSGRGIFYIQGDVYPFAAGDISVIYPGEYHIAQSVSETPSDWWFLTIDEKKLFADWPDRERLLRLASGGYGHILKRNENRQIHAALRRMTELYREDSTVMDGLRGQMGALYACILYETAGWQRDTREEGTLPAVSGAGSMISPAIQYMLSYYTDPVTTEELCALCHISPVHLRRIFTASVGISPIAFLHRVRISHACLALSGTDDSILSIAERCGYPSLSSFNRQFQKQMHKSPSEYRRDEAGQ